MLKLWKMEAKTGNATIKYPFAPLPVNDGMRGKPVHDAKVCIACAACAVACPANAIWMDVDTAQETVTWNINFGRCIFCGRCEEQCPFDAIKLSQEFELAVMTKEDLHEQAVYQLASCKVCGQPFAPRKELDYARRVLEAATGKASSQVEVIDICPDCRRLIDAERAKAASVAANAARLLEQVEVEEPAAPASAGAAGTTGAGEE